MSESVFYQLPAVMSLPSRPRELGAPQSDEPEDVLAWAEEAVSGLHTWAMEMHSSIYDSYIPQTDRIENMVMVGETITERPSAIGSRRFFYHRPNNVLYLDVRYGDQNYWDVVFSQDATIIELNTSNFNGVLGPSDSDLQVAMDALDDHVHPAEQITVDTSGFGAVLGSTDDDVQHALETIDNLSHLDIQDIGTNDHAAIDLHIGDASIHAPIPSINYAYVSGVDASTDVSGAELEELTDGSDTTLHNHDGLYYTELEVDTLLTGYLPLTAGAGSQVSGDLYAQQSIIVGSLVGDGILIDPANGIYLYGSAMAWDDLRFPALDTKLGGSKDPSFAVFKTNGAGSQGVFLYWFDKTTEQELYFVAQLPHRWAQGTDLEVHCHWVPKATAAGAGTDVCWGLEYTWANINGTFGNTAIIYGDEQTNGATETLTAGKHYLTELGTISGTGKTLSSMLVCRIFRDAGGTGGTDDYDDDAGLLEVDFHIQIDSLGSDDEYTKGP